MSMTKMLLDGIRLDVGINIEEKTLGSPHNNIPLEVYASKCEYTISLQGGKILDFEVEDSMKNGKVLKNLEIVSYKNLSVSYDDRLLDVFEKAQKYDEMMKLIKAGIK